MYELMEREVQEEQLVAMENIKEDTLSEIWNLSKSVRRRFPKLVVLNSVEDFSFAQAFKFLLEIDAPCPTSDNELQKRGKITASVCYFCHRNEDSSDHIFWGFEWAVEIRGWGLHLFNLNGSNINSMKDLIDLVQQSTPDETRVCCDGASTGNPGIGGNGAVFRDNSGSVLAVLVINLAFTTAYYAENVWQ
ncbi:hypothetical protein GIB67_042111 [Kingdonia uniflora]|uniref:RNase H type-1 domain-containing protein n=1 Tax=Kingdonia uniflora TaxID=39325 RepID=A0A7J7NPA6_9MAGN|nr:hypothetical protein GIB67_042111 [Kingdonia uniflora]